MTNDSAKNDFLTKFDPWIYRILLTIILGLLGLVYSNQISIISELKVNIAGVCKMQNDQHAEISILKENQKNNVEADLDREQRVRRNTLWIFEKGKPMEVIIEKHEHRLDSMEKKR